MSDVTLPIDILHGHGSRLVFFSWPAILDYVIHVSGARPFLASFSLAVHFIARHLSKIVSSAMLYVTLALGLRAVVSLVVSHV